MKWEAVMMYRATVFSCSYATRLENMLALVQNMMLQFMTVRLWLRGLALLRMIDD